MNKFILIGYVGNDPEERSSPNGVKMLIFSVPMHKFQGENKFTTWVRCVSFGNQPFIEKYVKKGSHVVVTGTLDLPRIYTSKTGKPGVALSMTVHQVDFCPGKREEQLPSPTGGNKEEEPADDLPF